ncbi:hypothetical protein ACFE04_022013 [Oxalis oulophora]
MRVPNNDSNAQSSPSHKPSSNASSDTNTRNIGFTRSNNVVVTSCYEPTSVLDLRRSPSPSAAVKPAADGGGTDISGVISENNNHHPPPQVEWDEHVLRNMDWDSIMRDLGLDDENTPGSKNIHQFTPSEAQIAHMVELTHQQFEPTQFTQPELALSDIYSNLSNYNSHQNFSSFDISNGYSHFNNFDFIEELIKAASCFDSNELQLAQVILTRLNQRLKSPQGKSLQRAAFFFKEALNSVLSSSTRPSRLSSWSDIVQTIRAYKAFSVLSPIPMFTQFTANQALLESLEGSPPFVHVIDFDIGLGGQYASLMREIAEKSDFYNKLVASSPVIRITAIVPEEYAIETRLIKDNLTQFAQELKIRFQIDFVLVRTFEMLSFKSIKFIEGEKIAVLFSPVIFRRFNNSSNDIVVSKFLNDLSRISPSVVVFVDNEGCMESSNNRGEMVTNTNTSFRRSFIHCLEFYSTIFESLDAAASAPAGDWVRKIETFIMRPRILAAVEGATTRRVIAPSWREAFCGAGFRPLHLSQFAEFQAECLLGKVQVRGFHVAKRHGELLLCWHDRALVATSAWRC